MLLIGRGWQSGISSEVRLAAMIPATRATAIASPLASVASRTALTVSGLILTRHSATASRTLTGLAPTSTIRAAPDSSRWVSLGSAGALAEGYARGSSGPLRLRPHPRHLRIYTPRASPPAWGRPELGGNA